MDKFDLIIIGGGPAGYNAAGRAAEAGLKTVLFEKQALGGVCLNEGCIPSKALLNSAKIYDYTRFSQVYGVTAERVRLDQKAVVARKDKVVANLVAGVGAKLRKGGVTVVPKEAVITGRISDGGYSVSADNKEYGAKYLLICTGSSAFVPPIEGIKDGLKNGMVLTNREILDLREIPKSLCVIGGGVIGLEMADYYTSAGSRVTVIEMLDRIAGTGTDAEISRILMGNLAKKGIKFCLSSKVISVSEGEVMYESGGNKNSVKCEKVLLSIGRKPNIVGIGLEAIGVNVEHGAIVTDEEMRTNVPNVFAAGDVNGRSMLAHTAYREGEVAINNILGKKDVMRYGTIPGVIYTHPETAGVGETEESARKKGYDVRCVRLSMNYSGRYMAENEDGDGICKIVINKKTDRILGVYMITPYASEIIYGAGLIIDTAYTVERLREVIFPHPSCAEIIREGLFL